MAAQGTQAANPANRPPAIEAKRDTGARKRIPMSVPRQKFAAPDLPGYHLHWILAENVPQALAAFYEFVKTDELDVNSLTVGGDSSLTGNADMGTNISIVGNKIGNNGTSDLQYLMKLKLEYWLEDKQALDERHASVMGSIFRGEQIISTSPVEGESLKGEAALRYVDGERTGARFAAQKPLFNRGARKGSA